MLAKMRKITSIPSVNSSLRRRSGILNAFRTASSIPGPYCLLVGDFVSALRTANLPEAGFLQLAVDWQAPAAWPGGHPSIGPLEHGYGAASSLDRGLGALRESVGADRQLGGSLAVSEDLDRELEPASHTALVECLRRDLAAQAMLSDGVEVHDF